MSFYSLLYRSYFKACRNWMGNQNLVNTILFKISSIFTQVYLNVIHKRILVRNNAYISNLHFPLGGVIASITTYPARINVVGYAIETIFNQSVKPDRIILWLAKSQFPKGEEELPEMIKKQIKRGLEVRFVEDYKSHKKYFFAMKEFPDSCIITFDDDVFYPPFIIEDLMEMHKNYPDCVCAHSASEIPGNNFYDMREWKSGHFSSLNEEFGRLRIIGISGVLYPPNVLHSDVLDVELRDKLCPWADDLWLTMMAYINGKRIVRYEHCSNPLDIWALRFFRYLVVVIWELILLMV